MENRRQHRRFEVAVAAEVTLRGETIEGETGDVSTGGVSVQVPLKLPDGEKVKLTLILTQDGIEDPNMPAFEAEATVMWTAPADGDESIAGLQFDDLPSKKRARLERFLEVIGS